MADGVIENALQWKLLRENNVKRDAAAWHINGLVL